MLITSPSCIYPASYSFEEAYVEFKIKVSKKVESEMSRLRTQASLVPLAECYRPTIHPKQKQSCFRMLDLSTSGSTSTYMMCEVSTTLKKLMSTFLLNQNFACQIEMMHISFRNLRFTDFSQSNIRTFYGTAVYLLMFWIVLNSIRM